MACLQFFGICGVQFFVGAISSAFLLAAAPKLGLGGIWSGLVLFMSLRAAAGFWRYYLRFQLPLFLKYG